jgi:hypothetical protein
MTLGTGWCLFLASRAVALTAVAFLMSEAATLAADQVVSLRACRVEFTEVGRHARFHGTALWRLQTNGTGKVEKMTDLRVPDFFPGFLRIDQLKCCVRQWRLQPDSSYTLAFFAGSDVPEWSLSVTGSGQKLQLVLPGRSDSCGGQSQAAGWVPGACLTRVAADPPSRFLHRSSGGKARAGR